MRGRLVQTSCLQRIVLATDALISRFADGRYDRSESLDRNVPLCFTLEAEFTRLGIAVRERVWASRFKNQTQRARVPRCWQASLNRDFGHVVLWFHWSDLRISNRGVSLSKTGGSG